MMSWFPPALKPIHQQPGWDTNSCAGRAVHSAHQGEKKTQKKKTCCGRRFRDSPYGTRCRLFHVVHVDPSGSAGPSHHRPPLLFLSLAGLLERAEAPGGRFPTSNFAVGRGQGSRGFWCGGGGDTLRLQHICVCSHQCVTVQYDGRLMLKRD